MCRLPDQMKVFVESIRLQARKERLHAFVKEDMGAGLVVYVYVKPGSVYVYVKTLVLDIRIQSEYIYVYSQSSGPIHL